MMIMERLRGYAERIERRNTTVVSNENLDQPRNGGDLEDLLEFRADCDTISDTTTVTLNDCLWSETFTSNSGVSAEERVGTPSQAQTPQHDPIIESIPFGSD
jgi:hypothetical protein